MKKKSNKQINKLEGTIFISLKGIGYVKIEGYEKDVEIDFRYLKYNCLRLDKPKEDSKKF